MSKDGILFIFNKAANRGNSSQKLNWLEDRIATDGLPARIVVPPNPESLEQRVKTAWEEGFGAIIVCGGDGTLNRVISSGLDYPYRFGIIPMGSGNDFSKSVYVPDTLEHSYRIALSKHVKPTDILQFSGDAEGYCINTLGFGLDGWANFYASKNRFFTGKLAYTFGAVRSILKFSGSPVTYQCDEVEESEPLLMITCCNGRIEGGNFPVAPQASIHDGFMDVLTIRPLPTLQLLYQLDRFKRGKAENLKEIKRQKCQKASFSSQIPAALHCDGEQIGTDIRNIDVAVLPGKIQFTVPES